MQSINSQYPSLLLERAVNEISRLPGIGTKTALRLALHLLRRSEGEVDALAQSLTDLRHGVRYCKCCHNICDADLCPICSSNGRDRGMVCVVENVRDVMAVESTMQFKGLYHVLGGIISPMDGVGPGDIEIASLVDRVAQGGIREVILALSPTMEGDATSFYIYRKLQDMGATITAIARGVAQNDELQYTDEATLGRAIVGRLPFAK